MKRRPKKPKRMDRIETVERFVENPDFSRDHAEGKAGNIRIIKAQVNVRESAIATLAARGALDAAQVASADRFRALWERMGGKGVKAIDYSNEPVDGGGYSDPIVSTQLEAGKQLKRCRELLGEYGYNLVRLVAGERKSIHEICGSRREREFTAMRLRQDLTSLAEMWNLQSRKRRRA